MLKAQLEIGGVLTDAQVQDLARILADERLPLGSTFADDQVLDEPGQDVEPEWYAEALREASRAGETLVLQAWEADDDEGLFLELYRDLARLGLTWRVFNPPGQDLDRGGWRNASIAVHGPGVTTGTCHADGAGTPILLVEEAIMADANRLLDAAQHLYQLRHQRLPPIAIVT